MKSDRTVVLMAVSNPRAEAWTGCVDNDKPKTILTGLGDKHGVAPQAQASDPTRP